MELLSCHRSDIRQWDGVTCLIGSPEVKAPVGWKQFRSAPTGERANRQVAAKANRKRPRKIILHENRSVGDKESAEPPMPGEG
jgi:hypothetical protein